MNAVRSFFCLMAARLFSMPANTTRGFRPLLTAAVYPSFSPAGIAEAVAMIGSRRLGSSKLLNGSP